MRPAPASCSSRPTASARCCPPPAGKRLSPPSAGGNAALAPADVSRAPFAAGGHLHVAGYALLRDGPPRAAALEALRRARANAMTISLDPSSAAPIERVGAARFLELAGHPDLLLPNRDEAIALTG